MINKTNHKSLKEVFYIVHYSTLTLSAVIVNIRVLRVMLDRLVERIESRVQVALLQMYTRNLYPAQRIRRLQRA